MEHKSTEVIDPVCNMKVNPATAKGGKSSYKGGVYYFCNPNCKTKFDTNPTLYLKKEEKPFSSGTDTEIYTCPMHPEIRKIGPGNCSICGMALEPFEVTLEETPNTELIDMTKRFWFGVAFTVPLIALAMGEMFSRFAGSWKNWAQLALATPVIVWAGAPLFKLGYQSFKSRNLNMFSLIALGTSVAYLFSIVATFFPNIFPEDFKSHGGNIGVYFEASAAIITLVLLGQVLELRARSQTSSAIKALLGLAPKTARKVSNNEEEDIPLEHVHVSDLLRVKPGEKVPVDGVVTEGKSFIDESMITGEPIPAEKGIGGKVTAGTINTSGSFVMRATRVGRDTLLSQIVKMVSEAQRSRAPIQKLADTVSSYFVPAVIIIAILTAIVWGTFGLEQRFAYAIVNAIAVLIIACPCALGLATPMSIMVGMGRGAQVGVLVKNAEALERLQKVDTIVFDKTGTLTEGKPKVTSIITANGFNETEVLRMACAIEAQSEHPLGQAIVSAAKEKNTFESKGASDFHSLSGQGVVGTVTNRKIAIGNEKLMAAQSITLDALNKRIEELRIDGQTVFSVGIDGKLAAIIGISDPIKESTREAIAALKAKNIRLIMLTGDHRATAEKVAQKLEIHEIEANVLPDQKQSVVKRLQSEGRIVAMAGDGVNDAPALAQADVGIAMGSGTDVAIQSADITLLKGDLRGLVRARNLSEGTMANIKQNLLFAFGYNALGVPIAAGVLYPVFGLLLSPMVASLAMSFSSVSVISNALRLKKLRL